jgi:WD40 repeat protein
MSPDRSLVATGSDDETVRVWDISAVEEKTTAKEGEREQGVPCKVFKSHIDWVYSVAFSPNGLHLASAGDNGCIIIWNLENQGDQAKPLRSWTDDWNSGRIRGLAFLADGERLLTVNNYGKISVWNPDNPGQRQCSLQVDDDQNFTSLQIHREHPDVLLNEFGAWPFKLDIAALKRGASSSLQCRRRDMPPSWSPVRIVDDGSWILWNNKKTVFLPTEFRPAYASSTWMCRVQGRSAVIGSQSGQVLLFRFSES